MPRPCNTQRSPAVPRHRDIPPRSSPEFSPRPPEFSPHLPASLRSSPRANCVTVAQHPAPLVVRLANPHDIKTSDNHTRTRPHPTRSGAPTRRPEVPLPPTTTGRPPIAVPRPRSGAPHVRRILERRSPAESCGLYPRSMAPDTECRSSSPAPSASGRHGTQHGPTTGASLPVTPWLAESRVRSPERPSPPRGLRGSANPAGFSGAHDSVRKTTPTGPRYWR